MNKKVFCQAGLIVVWLLLFCAPALANDISVRISEQAVVQGTQVTLGDLAEISGDDENRVAFLRNLPLGPSPAPGEQLVWTAQILGARLLSTGADFSGIDWQTPSAMTITTASQIVPAEQLKSVSVEAIRQLLGPAADSGDITIEPAGPLRDLPVAAGSMKLSAALPSGIHYSAPTTVIVRVDVQDHPPATAILNYDIHMYRNIVLVGHEIAAHELIAQEALHLERMEVGRLSGGYFTNLADVAGYAAKRSLAPGMIITKSMLEKPILIKRGATVVILAQSGSLQVTAQGEALQDGRNGQLIRVMNIQSRKVILAQILDAGTVMAPSYYRP